jgi:hypothetical protein
MSIKYSLNRVRVRRVLGGGPNLKGETSMGVAQVEHVM